MSYSYSYPRPALSADAVVYCEDDDTLLLIQRKNPPFKDQWALPGGFVEKDEEPFAACTRELREETQLNLDKEKETLVGVFGEKGRDPRGWIVSCCYFFVVELSAKEKAIAGSDSKNVQWYPIDQLPELTFDHSKMIKKARRYI